MQLGPISSRRTVIWAQWEAGMREMGNRNGDAERGFILGGRDRKGLRL